MTKRHVSNEKQIEMYLHCKGCFEEGEVSRLAIGWTEVGLQVWCEQCSSNVVNIDFEGRRHPANTTRGRKN